MIGAVLLGAGTALVYPTLLAAIGDIAHPDWRASAIGVYRFWRDLGYAVGAILAGVVADFLGLTWAVVVNWGAHFHVRNSQCDHHERVAQNEKS